MKTKNLFIYIPLSLLMIISLFIMHSIKSINEQYNPYFIKQSIWFVTGIICLIITKKIPFNKLKHLPLLLYILNNILLLLVLFIGKDINGAKAWFNLKYFSFQPSELMKFILCLYISQIISKHKKLSLRDDLFLIIKVLTIIIIPSILVFLEPDTGAIVIYLIIGLTMLLMAKLNKWWYILSTLLITIILFLFFYFYFHNPDFLIKLIGSSFYYRMDRILNFTNQNGFQIKSALIAIGSTNLITFQNKGTIYIPEAATDFIVSYLINTTGLIGLTILLIIYLVINIYFLNLISISKHKQKKLFISGFLAMFIFQQVQNILMNVGLLPIMGIPLPFLSYGGTNIIVYFIFIGYILNNKKNKITKK